MFDFEILIIERRVYDPRVYPEQQQPRYEQGHFLWNATIAKARTYRCKLTKHPSQKQAHQNTRDKVMPVRPTFISNEVWECHDSIK